MEVSPPAVPVFDGQRVLVTSEYRVQFWEHQLPPEGSAFSAHEMGWTELAFDLVDVEDVQEAIEWAESNLNARFDDLRPGPSGERLYVLYAKVPNEDSYVQVAGWDPARDRREPIDNLRRRRP